MELILAPCLSTFAAMRYFGAQRIDPHDVMPAAKAMERLAAKAGLPTSLYLPDTGIGMNSVAVDRRADGGVLLTNLPINNFHRFADYEDWLDFYSSFYPPEEEREEIYRLDDCYAYCSP